MNRILSFLLGVLVLLPGTVRSQVLTDVVGPRVYASPSVEGMGRSRGIVVRYDVLPQFKIHTTSPNPEVGPATGQVGQNRRLDVRLNAPLLNKPATKIVLGFQYTSEKYQFADAAGYGFFENLDERRLRIMGTHMTLLHSLREHEYFLLRLRGNINGDFNSVRSLNIPQYMRYSLQTGYGRQPNPRLSYGLALQVNYNFGRLTALPAIVYNHTFNDRWGIETIFPARVMVRRNVSEKTLLYAGYGGESARYNLRMDNPAFAGADSLQLRRIDVRGRLRLEQEIYDFLWFGLETGVQGNLRYRGIDNFSGRSRDALIWGRTQLVPYLQAEIYLVPPRRFSKGK